MDEGFSSQEAPLTRKAPQGGRALSATARRQQHKSPYFKNSSLQTFSHFGASSIHLIGSTMTCLCWSSSVFWVRLDGTRPSSLSSFIPSGDSTKSTNSSAACGCGAFLATASACGRPTSGSTAIQSIGPPFLLIDSALPL